MMALKPLPPNLQTREVLDVELMFGKHELRHTYDAAREDGG